MKKRFIGCIYLKDGKAVTGFNDDTVINANPVEYAKMFREEGVDELIIYDQSDTDEEHDESLGIMKRISEDVEIPMIGAGNVKRMEDVKKMLYAGCKKAVLNLSKKSNLEIMEEVSKKFGQEKIVVCAENAEQISSNLNDINDLCSEIILLNEVELKESIGFNTVPIIAVLPDIALNKVLDVLSFDNISAITGEMVNNSVKEVENMKTLCVEKGINVISTMAALKWEQFKLNSDGMVTVVVQDYKTDEVLMVAYMNEEAYNTTLETNKMTYWSRSRDELWIKGETSGHYQYVKSLTADCDFDTILAKVSQIGAACHTGSKSCFFNEILARETEEKANPLKVFEEVFAVIKDRKIHPKEGSYTNYLYEKGIDKILKKCGEEATEIVIAAKNPNPDELKYEISDFLYHVMVLMAEKDVTWEEITTELAQR